MSSVRRLISSRLNGAKSKGPKTVAGKLRSSRNALLHGCRSRQFRDTLLPGESQEQFDQLLQEHISALHPRNEAEHAAIRRMVFARWRARRLQALETSMWNDVLRGQAEPDLITSYEILFGNPSWAAISRNENACDLAYFRELRRYLRAEKQNRTNKPTLCIPYAAQGSGAGYSRQPAFSQPNRMDAQSLPSADPSATEPAVTKKKRRRRTKHARQPPRLLLY